MTEKKAVVLLSGGLDSSVLLAYVLKEKKMKTLPIVFDYGQRHLIEIEAAKKVSESLGCGEVKEFKIALSDFKGSSLTDKNLNVPENDFGKIGDNLPNTYVPARNLVFLSVASAWAEASEAFYVFYGANSLDYSGYPDCRPEFVESFEKTVNLGTGFFFRDSKLKISAPFLYMKKSEIVSLGKELGVDFSLTHSCYNPGAEGKACGKCDSCKIRREAFRSAGVFDPTPYA
ncbi:7-cyano-7-deazaguanine synthase QueC [candidate division WOR-3 bacterium]|nr:7-cyano-7-deazaguanine synthase QueC [candidate division WOR-3 bacterium]